jgi:hypothetical protein
MTHCKHKGLIVSAEDAGGLTWYVRHTLFPFLHDIFFAVVQAFMLSVAVFPPGQLLRR